MKLYSQKELCGAFGEETSGLCMCAVAHRQRVSRALIYEEVDNKDLLANRKNQELQALAILQRKTPRLQIQDWCKL